MTIVDESNDRIALLTIYDKQDADTVDLNVIRKMTRELGFILEQSPSLRHFLSISLIICRLRGDGKR